MDQGQNSQGNAVNGTDYLEAIGVFKGWKNFLFIIVLLGLLLLQAAFWLVNTGYVGAGETAESIAGTAAPEKSLQVQKLEPQGPAAEKAAGTKVESLPGGADQIEQAAKKVAGDVNLPAQAAKTPQPVDAKGGLAIGFDTLARAIQFLNFVLVLTAVLYCLTMLFSLMVSLLGKLGGINHIARAFFLSLVMVVLLLPWQKLFGGVVSGAMYTSEELLRSYAGAEQGKLFGTMFFYLRFTGYWVIVMLLLILAQLRSSRWARATLRRLEVL